MSSSKENQEIPVIDFSCVDLTVPGAGQWNTVAAQVVEALQSHGCFQALHHTMFTPELRAEVLSSMRDDLFALPLQTKLNNTSEKPFHGYLGQTPGLDSESLAIMNPTLPHGVPDFVNQLWPHHGNPTFSDRAKELSEKMVALEVGVRSMVMQGLGVKTENAERLADSTWHFLRFWEYGKEAAAAEKRGVKGTGYLAHRDSAFLAVVWQLNDVDGLEVRVGDGDWFVTRPSPSSLIVIAGAALRAWSNGRIYAPLHRIMVAESVRYTAILFSIPKDDFIIEAPEEMVDQPRRRLFRPYTHLEYLHFYASEEGMKSDCKLTANFLA